MNKIAAITTAHNEDYQFNQWVKFYNEYKDDIDYHIIVDNHSEKKYFQMIKQQFNNSYILSLEEDKGITGGFNEGIKLAQKLDAEIILFIIQDMHLPTGNVTTLKNILLSDKNYAVVAPIIFKENNSNVIRIYGGKINKLDFTISHLYRSAVFNEVLPDIMEVEFVCGGVYMIRKNIFSEVGLYDENIFMYGDETDLFLRIHNFGLKIIVTSKAKCWHEHVYEGGIASKYKSPNANAIFYTARNYFYLIKKHGSFFSLFFGLLKSFASLPLFFFRFVMREKSIEKFKSVLLGYIKGFLLVKTK